MNYVSWENSWGMVMNDAISGIWWGILTKNLVGEYAAGCPVAKIS